MTGFFEKMHDAERALVETLIQPLWAHLGRLAASEPSRVADFLDVIAGEGIDPDAARIMNERTVELQTFKAVRGLIEWSATGIVRRGDYRPQEFVMPGEASVAAIAEEYDVKPAYVRFVAERLQEELVIPLLGRMEDGCLVPDAEALTEWASHFDWREDAAAS